MLYSPTGPCSEGIQRKDSSRRSFCASCSTDRYSPMKTAGVRAGHGGRGGRGGGEGGGAAGGAGGEKRIEQGKERGKGFGEKVRGHWEEQAEGGSGRREADGAEEKEPRSESETRASAPAHEPRGRIRARRAPRRAQCARPARGRLVRAQHKARERGLPEDSRGFQAGSRNDEARGRAPGICTRVGRQPASGFTFSSCAHTTRQPRRADLAPLALASVR